MEGAVVGDQGRFQVKGNCSDGQVEIRLERAAPPQLRLQGTKAPCRRVTKGLKARPTREVVDLLEIGFHPGGEVGPVFELGEHGSAENDVLRTKGVKAPQHRGIAIEAGDEGIGIQDVGQSSGGSWVASCFLAFSLDSWMACSISSADVSSRGSISRKRSAAVRR